uniref:Uncharacterized protein n=1 Tax=Zea mays TaxID=4577 RepID=A0A804QC43_MAIZE
MVIIGSAVELRSVAWFCKQGRHLISCLDTGENINSELGSLIWACVQIIDFEPKLIQKALHTTMQFRNGRTQPEFHAAGGRRGADVEVLFPGSNVVGNGSATASDFVPPVTSNVDSTNPASALSVAKDSKSLPEKAIAALPPELSAQATDPKRKASIWHALDEALGVTQALQGRNLPRLAAAGAASSSRPQRTYVRTSKRSRNAAAQDIGEDDSDAQQDGNATADEEEQQEQPLEATRDMDQVESESGGGKTAAFCLDVDLL